MEKDHRHEIIENFSQYHIGLDDVFTFKCRSCGKCCKNREDILLNSRDLYNIATALKITHKQVIDKYCETYIGRDSRIPIVRLKPRGTNKACPLLVGDRCSVHLINPSLKPIVCALYPLGRVMASEAATKELASENGFDAGLCRPNEIQYILHPNRCGSLKRKQTVRSWLEGFGIPIEDDFFIKWNKTLFELIMVIQKIEEKPDVTPKTLEMLWGAIFSSLYIDYVTHEDFQQQFENNMSKLLRVFDSLEKVF